MLTRSTGDGPAIAMRRGIPLEDMDSSSSTPPASIAWGF